MCVCVCIRIKSGVKRIIIVTIVIFERFLRDRRCTVCTMVHAVSVLLHGVRAKHGRFVYRFFNWTGALLLDYDTCACAI